MLVNFRRLSLIVSAISLIFLFTAPAFSQKTGKRYRYIPLKKDETKNGYKTYRRGREEIFLIAMGVEDPRDGKKLEGEKEVEFKCEGSEIPILKTLKFFNGTSTAKKVECLIFITPRILLPENEEDTDTSSFIFGSYFIPNVFINS